MARLLPTVYVPARPQNPFCTRIKGVLYALAELTSIAIFLAMLVLVFAILAGTIHA